MNVNQVLEGTLANDDATRRNAEQQLNQAAEVDFPAYLITLAQELANDSAQPHIRAAAGLALKNAFSFREYPRLREVQQKWTQQIEQSVKNNIKNLALNTLKSNDRQAGQSAGQFIASIAGIELPRNQWPELMPTLVENVASGGDRLKQSSLTTIGYICESEDSQLREALSAHSNSILTAVVQGARKEETNLDVRNAAMTALSDSLEFVRTNFENEGERNYIMQVVCEATQSGDTRIEASAYGCLNRIMGLYYDKMKFYMEKALYGLTIIGMKSEEEDVAKLAVEFWCTVCEEEIAIEDDNQLAQAEGSTEMRMHYGFTSAAAPEVVPTLLLLMTKQDDDATDEEYNVSRAAYQCLQLYSQCIGRNVMQFVIPFVQTNITNPDWHNREAAVSALGAIMEGPDEETLQPMVKEALQVILQKMSDENVHVRDSAAFTIGRICEIIPTAIDAETQLPTLIDALFTGLTNNPRLATSCCWALMSIADNFCGEPGCQSNALSPHFQNAVQAILSLTEKPDANGQLRVAAYEVLNTFVTNSAHDNVEAVAELSNVILSRLEGTVPMQSQIVSVEDRMTLEEIQTSLASCLLAIIQRLEGQIKPQADRIMNILLQLLSAATAKSNVPDAILATIGALATCLDQDFEKYMDSFVPFLYTALANQEEPAICSMAIGLVSDIVRSLEEKSQRFCDEFMNHLLTDLQSPLLGNQFKPAILQCFGDIAHAIGPHFKTYLSIVAQILQQAAKVQIAPDNGFEMVEYVVSLREGIMDAWSGIIFALKQGEAQALAPFVESIFTLLGMVATDQNRTEGLLRSSMGVIGDIADTFPGGEFASALRADWVLALIRETRQNREYQSRTHETARWAKELVKRQPITFNAQPST